MFSGPVNNNYKCIRISKSSTLQLQTSREKGCDFFCIFTSAVKPHVMCHTTARLPVFSACCRSSSPPAAGRQDALPRAHARGQAPDHNIRLSEIFLGESSEKKTHLERTKIPKKRDFIWKAVSILYDLFFPSLLV